MPYLCVRAVGVLATFVTAMAPAGQAPPAFVGHWIFAGDRSPASSPSRNANFGLEFDLRLDGTTLTVERAAGAQKATSTYTTDDTETVVTQNQAVTKTRARWEGSVLVMEVSTTSAPAKDGTLTTTVSTRRIWIEGDALISEWVIRSPIQATGVSVYRHPLPPGPPAPPAKATLAAIAWLAGTWEGKMGTTSLEERWTPAAGGAMLAVSRTVSGSRMVAFEFLRIIERDGTLVYLAQPNGRAPATEFTLTRIGAAEAVFENPAHDFPKMIAYSLAADGTLTAVISDTGGLKPQSFVFKK